MLIRQARRAYPSDTRTPGLASGSSYLWHYGGHPADGIITLIPPAVIWLSQTYQPPTRTRLRDSSIFIIFITLTSPLLTLTSISPIIATPSLASPSSTHECDNLTDSSRSLRKACSLLARALFRCQSSKLHRTVYESLSDSLHTSLYA